MLGTYRAAGGLGLGVWLCIAGLAACGSSSEPGAAEGPAAPSATSAEAAGGAPEQEAFLDQHADAVSAVGSWSYDEDGGQLELTLDSSEIGCGVSTDATLRFSVPSVGDSELQTRMGQDAEATVAWERVGDGSGIEGTWRSVDGETIYLLTLRDDGAAFLSVAGQDESRCGDDGMSDVGYTTEEGCYVDRLPKASVVADGALDDWADVDPIDDPAGDSDPASEGDELVALYLAADDAQLAVRIGFAEALPVDPGAPVRNVVVGYATENGVGSVRVRFEDGEVSVQDGRGGEQVAAAARDLEVTLPWASLGNRSLLVSLHVRVTSDEPGSEPLDDGLCFNEAGP